MSKYISLCVVSDIILPVHSYMSENVFYAVHFCTGTQLILSNTLSCFLSFCPCSTRARSSPLMLKGTFPFTSKQFGSMPYISSLLEKWICITKNFQKCLYIVSCLTNIKMNLLLCISEAYYNKIYILKSLMNKLLRK